MTFEQRRTFINRSITELSRKEIRESSLGRWDLVHYRYAPAPNILGAHEYDEYEFIPRPPHAPVFWLEYNARGGTHDRMDWHSTGWYVAWPGCGGESRFMHRRRENAMHEAELFIVLLLLGKRRSDLYVVGGAR